MNKKGLLAAIALVAAVLVFAFWAVRPGGVADRIGDPVLESTRGFAPYPLPIGHSDRLFDIGVVDANGDGRLDIYTSNHHFGQVLLLADGRGGYTDVLNAWGLDQSRDFPRAELSFAVPTPDRPGIYVYWRGTNVVVRAHAMPQPAAWRGSMRVFDPVEVVNDGGYRTTKQETKHGAAVETTVSFEPAVDGMLVLRPGGQGLPLNFSFAGNVRPEQIFVGLGKVSPASLDFALAMRDRHAMAWADFNADGVMDVFINRGALGGTVRALPPEVQRGIADELLLSTGPGRYRDAAAEAGIDKRGCSGRHATWVDYDGDGLLDLFVNCYDRENVAGDYPKQLYRQQPRGVLRDVAADVGLALPDQHMNHIAWVDVDGDGDSDLVAFQELGVVLYRNDAGRFLREIVHASKGTSEDRRSRADGTASFYDGKLAVADFNGDASPDVFASSRHGNVLLRNVAGRLESIDLAAAGLPESSMYASWVDVDNDGRVDLHLFPQGIHRQLADGRFEATGQLAAHPEKYRAAIVNWADLDNDGRLDLLLALDEDSDFRRWWQFNKPQKQRSRWSIAALRNDVAAESRWLQVSLQGDDGNRDGIGARIVVRNGGAQSSYDVGQADGAFFSRGHHRVYVGLGGANAVEKLTIRWTDGSVQQLTAVEANRRVTIEKTESDAKIGIRK